MRLPGFVQVGFAPPNFGAAIVDPGDDPGTPTTVAVRTPAVVA
jgi:hypothetical protein